jgi:proteasome accessory factor B
MRRIERLINLIAALLDAPQPLTADQIRERIAGYEGTSFGAFRRSFERDKEALRAMGIPLELRSLDPGGGEADGYIIPKERYYLPDLDLAADELAALRLAAEALLGSTEVANAGLMKLAFEGDEHSSRGPRVAWGADLAAEQPLLAPIYSAVLERKTVRFGYRRAGSQSPDTRTVNPYSLVHKRGHWYLVGLDAGRDGIRAFKVSRITGSVTTVGDAGPVPAGFDPTTHLGGESWEVGPDDPATATVFFSGDLKWWAEQNLGEHPAKAVDGGVEVELPVANIDAFVSWVIGFGGEVKIRAPDIVRDRLRAHLSPWLEGRP